MALTESEQERKVFLESSIDAIQKALLGILSTGKLSMSVNGRSATNMSTTELEALRRSYYSELKGLERKEAGITTRTIRCIG